MYRNKRALTFWLGLFFCLFFSLDAQENSVSVPNVITAGAGTLLVGDTGSSYYWHSGLALTLEQDFFLSFDLGQVHSTLPWLNGSGFGVTSKFGIDTPKGGFIINSGSFKHSLVSAAMDKVSLSSEGGQGFFFNIEMPLHFGFFSIEPYFLFGSAFWDDGDLYWFFGKPKLPSLHVLGLNISLGLHELFSQEFSFRWVSAFPGIITNDDKPIFDAHINSGFFSYQFSFENKKNSFSGTLGWLYARAEMEGALTTADQPYFLFPFLFYRIDAYIEAQAGVAMFNFRYNRPIFRYELDLGAIHVFFDRGKVDTHYQMKRLFGGSESTEEIPLDIKGVGAAFLVFKASLPALSISEKQRLSLHLQKAVALPWGYEKLVSSITGSSGQPSEVSDQLSVLSRAEVLSLIKTALFSGLSFSGSLSW